MTSLLELILPLKPEYITTSIDGMMEEGERCLMAHCDGHMEYTDGRHKRDGGCSCFQGYAPCSHCTNMDNDTYVCDTCDYETYENEDYDEWQYVLKP